MTVIVVDDYQHSGNNPQYGIITLIILGTVENHGNIEITKAVDFIVCCNVVIVVILIISRK